MQKCPTETSLTLSVLCSFGIVFVITNSDNEDLSNFHKHLLKEPHEYNKNIQ